jgi:hypothetical protein
LILHPAWIDRSSRHFSLCSGFEDGGVLVKNLPAGTMMSTGEALASILARLFQAFEGWFVAVVVARVFA